MHTTEHAVRPQSAAVAMAAGPARAGEFAHRVARSIDACPAVLDDAAQAVAWAGQMADAAPAAGEGQTRSRWEGLATAARCDVGLAFVLEQQLEVRALLKAAARQDIMPSTTDSTSTEWGLFTEEQTSDVRAARSDHEWHLDGTSRCCLAPHLVSQALVCADTPEGERMFIADLRRDDVHVHDSPQGACGRGDLPRMDVEFTHTPARPVGDAGWYSAAPEYWWARMTSTAGWWGGALPLLGALRSAAGDAGDQLAHHSTGMIDAALWAVRAAVREAADEVDARVHDAPGRLLAQRVRVIAAGAIDHAIAVTERALSPAIGSRHTAITHRIADLRRYIHGNDLTHEVVEAGVASARL